MEIKCLIKIPKFIECNVNKLLENVNDVEYTGFYLPNGNINSYFFKVGNNYYIVKSNNFESIEKMLVNELNRKKSSGIKVIHYGMDIRCTMGITDLMDLYNYSKDVRVSDCFYIKHCALNGNQNDFLHLIKNVLQIERDMIIHKIDKSDKYAVMKFIYDKYKMSASYWNPIRNYGEVRSAKSKLRDDNKRVVRHPHNFLGLINENYATCEGMADGLVELYRYFGIDAEIVENGLHALCMINLRDKDGQRKVTYIDLSREIASEEFVDSKYEYRSGIPIPRPAPKRFAEQNSYKYFMKASAGKYIGDSNLDIAVDFRPPIKVTFPEIRIIGYNGENVANRRGK